MSDSGKKLKTPVDPASAPAPAQKASFEALLKALEKTVADLEGGALGLDGSLEAYEQGVSLLNQCRKRLDEAERKIAIVTGLSADGAPETAPFEPNPQVLPIP